MAHANCHFLTLLLEFGETLTIGVPYRYTPDLVPAEAGTARRTGVGVRDSGRWNQFPPASDVGSLDDPFDRTIFTSRAPPRGRGTSHTAATRRRHSHGGART